MVKKWKVTQLNALLNKLNSWQDKETQKALSKGNEVLASNIEDKYQTLVCLIHKHQDEGKNTVSHLTSFIENLFGDTKEGAKPTVLTLSSVHKSKGREWDRVYLLGRNKYMPSKWVVRDWQLQQERNLMYVAVTRAKKELVEIIVE